MSSILKRIKASNKVLLQILNETKAKKDDLKAKIDDHKENEDNIETNEAILEQIVYQYSRLKQVYDDLKQSDADFNLHTKSITKDERPQLSAEMDKLLEESNFHETLMYALEAINLLEARRRDLERVLKKLTKVNANDATINRNSSIVSTENTTSHSIKTSIKYPEIDIGNFDGDPIQYRSFFDIFDALVGDTEMPDITKLIYLKRSCIGKAKNAIAQYPTTSENYQICRNVLKNRFGDEKHVIMTLHVELQNLQVGSPKTSDLRKFSEDVERICSLFELVGEDANHRQILVSLEKALPKSVLDRLLLLKKPTEEWDVETLRKYLQQYLSNREHVDAVQNFKSPSQEQPKQTSSLVATRKQGQRQNQPQGKSNQNFCPSQQQQRGRKGKCPFCNESHGPSRCNVFGTSEVRKNRAVQRNLCLKCLSSKHDSSSCSNHFECRLCHSFEHHLSLCHLINSYQAERSHS
uniref:Uncharacterized protein n=1 Tax=Acrobeloides nanus TaxID=290746 RepID=A0A914BY84_9BILA